MLLQLQRVQGQTVPSVQVSEAEIVYKQESLPLLFLDQKSSTCLGKDSQIGTSFWL